MPIANKITTQMIGIANRTTSMSYTIDVVRFADHIKCHRRTWRTWKHRF